MWSSQDVDEAYLEQLSDGDVAVLLAGGAAGRGGTAGAGGAAVRGGKGGGRAELRRRGVEQLLGAPGLIEAVLGAPLEGQALPAVSPFLLFATAVQATAAGLARASYVSQWTGPGRSIPVFDGPRLSGFLADPWHRLFLAELLASYTHVSSGSVLVPTRRGLRRQRWSELDPVRLAGLLDSVLPAERPGVLRRLGDLSLFLTGVFPDHVARRGFGPIEEGRLLRAGTAVQGGTAEPSAAGPAGGEGAPTERGSFAAVLAGDGGAVGLLDELGRRWYRSAYRLLAHPVPARTAVIGELPERFGEARRILNHLSERYLFTRRERLFGRSA